MNINNQLSVYLCQRKNYCKEETNECMKNNEWLFFSRNDLPDANGIIQQENRSSQVPNIIGDDESQGDEGGKKWFFIDKQFLIFDKFVERISFRQIDRVQDHHCSSFVDVFDRCRWDFVRDNRSFDYCSNLVRDRIEMNIEKIIDKNSFVQINVDWDEDVRLDRRIPLIEDFVWLSEDQADRNK